MYLWVVTTILTAEVLIIVGLMVALSTNNLFGLPDTLLSVIGSVLLGGLGSCTYCLRGVYLNACVHKKWDDDWLPWYIIRPLVGLILGGVSYLFVKSGLLLLNAQQQPDASPLGIWAVAFLAGVNIDKFIAKIEAVGQTLLGLERSRQSKKSDSDEEKSREAEGHAR